MTPEQATELLLAMSAQAAMFDGLGRMLAVVVFWLQVLCLLTLPIVFGVLVLPWRQRRDIA